MQKTIVTEKNIVKNPQTELKNETKNKFFYIYLSTLLLLLLALFVSKSMFLVLVMVLVFAVFGKFDETIAFLMFIFPFKELFTLEKYSHYVILVEIVIAIFILKYCFEVYKKKKSIDWFLLISLLTYLVYIMLPIRYAEYGDGLASNCALTNAPFHFLFAISIYLCFVNKDEMNSIFIVKSFIVGFLISNIFGLLTFSGSLADKFGHLKYHGINLARYAGLLISPNGNSLFASFIFCGILFLTYNKKLNSIESNIYLTLTFVFGYISLTRLFIVVAAVALVLYFTFVFIKEKKQSFKQLIPIIVELSIVLLIFFDYTKSHLSRFGFSDLIHGYDNLAHSDKLNEVVDPGRGGLLKRTLKDYLSSALTILFGRGVSHNSINGFSPHNTYMQAFWCVGLVGVAILCFIMILFLKHSTKTTLIGLLKNIFLNLGLYILIIPIGALLFVEDMFISFEFIFVFIFIFALINSTKKENKENDLNTLNKPLKNDTK